MIGRLVRDAYRTSVDVETASRHLWRLYHVAAAGGGRGARRMLVSAFAAVLLFVTTAATVVLSGDSLPGDSLYLVKRGAERVHLMVSFAPESDARLHLRFARARAAEAQAVATRRPDRLPHLLSEIVAAFEQASLAGGTGVVDEMELLRGEVSTTLSTLNAVVDSDVAASVDAALNELGSGRAVSGTEDDPSSVDDPQPAPSGPRDAVEPAPPGERDPVSHRTAEPTAEPTTQPTPEPTTEQLGKSAQEEAQEAPTQVGSPQDTAIQDTAIPVLDHLESLLDEAGTEPGH